MNQNPIGTGLHTLSGYGDENRSESEFLQAEPMPQNSLTTLSQIKKNQDFFIP